MRVFQKIFLALAIAGVAGTASAFSLGGPFDTWQTPGIGYNPLGAEVMGPMNLGEEYRINVRTLTYAFDPSFINYFGQRGIDEINKAIALMNALPPMSSLSSNLNEIPLDTQHVNYEASALGLTDLKSFTLGILVQHLGLASPERWTWTLRDRRPIAGTPDFQYLVIKRNFDPGSTEPSSYVNGVLYTYRIDDPILLTGGGQFADAVEIPVDPLEIGFNAVASVVNGFWGGPLAISGEFLTGLTRDDIGGLRYLYTGGKKSRYTNLNIENLPTDATLATGNGSGWGTGGGGATNGVAVDLAVRPGVDKVIFKQARFDSGGFGFFVPLTNVYKDTFLIDTRQFTQKVQRIQTTTPDILFAAADIGLNAGGLPRLVTITLGFINNAALNGNGLTGGPGVVIPGSVITFNKLDHALVNQSPNAIDEASAGATRQWGSYDGSTNPPAVYPIGSSIQALIQKVLNGQ